MTIPETFFSISEQLRLFLFSCLFGAVIGVFYDLFRAIRILLPHNSVLVAIEDVIFIVLYAVFAVAFTSAAARGEFRFYYVLGNVIGFAVYFFTVGSVVIKVINRLINILIKVLKFILHPFKLLFVVLCKKFKLEFVNFCQKYDFSKKIRKRHLIIGDKIVYNRSKNKKRKNVKNVEKNKGKKKKGTSQRRTR